MIRWIGIGLLALLGTGIVAAAAAYLLLDRYDFGPFAARRASAALGRPVSIESLRVTPGRWIAIDLQGARLDNASGGTRPAMAEAGRISAEVEALSLLRGPLAVRSLVAEGVSVLLERTADGTSNWRFGPARTLKPEGPADRSWFPALRDATLRGGEVVFRTSGGAALRTRVDEAAVLTAGDDRPVRLTARGSYNGAPIRMEGDLQPIAALRDAATPYGAELRLASGDTTLDFKGTLAEPFDVDGVRGTVALSAPTPEALLAIAGVTGDLDASLTLAGTLERQRDLWRLTDATGALEGSGITAGSLRFVEGARGKPDDVALDLAFDSLDLNEALGTGKRGSRPDADIPLHVNRAPDTLLRARLTARELVYGRVQAIDAGITAALTPGRVTVEELALTYLGARIQASGRVEAAGDEGGRVSVDVSGSDLDVQRLRRELGFGPVPLQGRMDAKVAVAAEGGTLNAAARAARLSAVVSMDNGAIGRNVVETASIDLRRLFRKAEGMSGLSCLLGVLDMRAGIGTVLPLRIRAADGTIVGQASFDLNRRRFDLTVGSQSATTSAFALDIPVRVSGSFADPSVRPARWSAAGRKLLAASEDAGRLPADLRQAARRSRCYAGR